MLYFTSNILIYHNFLILVLIVSFSYNCNFCNLDQPKNHPIGIFKAIIQTEPNYGDLTFGSNGFLIPNRTANTPKFKSTNDCIFIYKVSQKIHLIVNFHE